MDKMFDSLDEQIKKDDDSRRRPWYSLDRIVIFVVSTLVLVGSVLSLIHYLRA